MSDASIALISSGAALTASAITGVLTWFAGHSNLTRQLAAQKETRHEQYRREVYAACLESLTAFVVATQMYAKHVPAGDELSTQAARQDVEHQLEVQLHRSTELQLVGPDALVQSFHCAADAVTDLATFIDEMPRGESGPGDPLDAVLPRFKAASEAVDDFGLDARRELGLG